MKTVAERIHQMAKRGKVCERSFPVLPASQHSGAGTGRFEDRPVVVEGVEQVIAHRDSFRRATGR
ncbi:MAG TPA: hypothetical protein VGV93_10550, partial [Acidimicrobiales bacterium]|nr:hypothetical protein [Acidimicrobiales bacterium]